MSTLSIDPTIYRTRPAPHNCPAVENAVYDMLQTLSVPFERVEHVPVPTMEECSAIGQLLGVEICKNLFLCNRQKTRFYLLMLPANKVFHTKDLSSQIGSARLSFADAETMQSLLKTTPGSASVLGLMNDTEQKVTLLIDRDVTAKPFFGCHPCVNTGSLKLSTQDLLCKLLPYMRHEPVFVTL